jgi:Protein of unknown function (DUF3570)
MKKILLAIGLYFSAYQADAQIVSFPNSTQTPVKGSFFEKRKLSFDEVNIMTSYYHQEGNRSAITGGYGTEKLTDYANSLEFKLSLIDQKNRTHSLVADVNFDYYTSASSDKIDSLSISSASREDHHFYPSLSYSISNKEKRQTIGFNASYSTEWDYNSIGGTMSYSKQSKDKNTEFTFKGGAFIDKWTVILPAELRTSGRREEGTKPRNSYNASFAVSQVINKRFDMQFMVEPAYQEGLLSTPFHRIYFSDKKLTIERLPGERMKLPISLRANYFLGDKFVIRSFYRYYQDNWGMKAHTASIEVPIKINSFFSISPFYRFNSQTAVDYYKEYGKHTFGDEFYTSDPDIAAFNSQFIGAGLRLSPPDGILGMQHFGAVELRYGYYTRTNTLTSNIVTLLMKFK